MTPVSFDLLSASASKKRPVRFLLRNIRRIKRNKMPSQRYKMENRVVTYSNVKAAACAYNFSVIQYK